MKQSLTRLFVVVLSLQSTYIIATSQVVLNEILLNTEFVELKNIGDTVVNVSQYYLVSNSTMKRIGSRFPLCANGTSFDIQPGGFLLTDVIPDYPASEGELAMFQNDIITDPANILDYVEWGSADQGHEGIAVAAGIWEPGDYVNAVLDGGSLEYDGSGDHSSDWETVAIPSSCADNGQKCEADIAVVIPEQNPFQICIGDETPEYFGFDFSGSTVQHRRVVVLDNEELIVNYSEDGENIVDLSDLTHEDTAGLHVVLLGYRGPIGLLGVNVHIDSLVGCYFVSDPVEVRVGFVEQGQLSAAFADSIYTGVIYVCAGDGIPDSITFHSSSPDSLKAFVVINPENNTVVDIALDSLVVDFEQTIYTELVVYSLSYCDSLVGEIGGSASSVRGIPCDIYAANEITVRSDSCVSALNEDTGILLLKTYPNPAGNVLILPGLPVDVFQVLIYSSDGRLVLTDDSISGLHNGECTINISGLPEGMYFVRSSGLESYFHGSFVKKDTR